MSPNGIFIVDHGSRSEESNRLLEEVARRFAGRYAENSLVVEPAHMELAEPSIATAFGRCVTRGARRVVVMPYFLLPGRHWAQDIPALTAQAAARHAGVEFLVTAPLGLHPLMAEVIRARIEHCVAHAAGDAAECEACAGTGRCRMGAGGAAGAVGEDREAERVSASRGPDDPSADVGNRE